ncbi:MAG: hypothetical protein V9G14_19270 [Cypionkella sp.]
MGLVRTCHDVGAGGITLGDEGGLAAIMFGLSGAGGDILAHRGRLALLQPCQFLACRNPTEPRNQLFAVGAGYAAWAASRG